MTINLSTIKKSLQPDVISSFWTMLSECESQAESADDRTLKHFVEGWYRQWNAMTGDEKAPRWITMALTDPAPEVKAAFNATEDTPLRRSITKRLRLILADQLGISVSVILDDTTVVSLGADSLDTIEIIMAIEDEFNVEIADEEAEAMTCINDAAHWLLTRHPGS